MKKLNIGVSVCIVTKHGTTKLGHLLMCIVTFWNIISLKHISTLDNMIILIEAAGLKLLQEMKDGYWTSLEN